ncbi:hypothetical protein BGZ93_004492 [Podila epicladia]|nr:hypothetical protein BGZ92_006204 [Podila epicladia]KAG0096460.1 hypothetical protein BGZ93_004492 [Podila epicladia]
MKFFTIALACVVASSSATVTHDLPFINALVMPENYKQNSTRPDIIVQTAGPSSDCQSYSDIRYSHNTIQRGVRDLISVQFVKVTLALCAKYTGFLMLGQGP